MNLSELRDAKIKLSRKEKELQELKDTLQKLLEKNTLRDQEFFEIQRERDILRLKNEIMNELLKKNGVEFDSSVNTTSVSQLTLIEEYT